MELLLGTERGRLVAVRIADPELSIHAPDLVDVEVVQALLRYVQEGDRDRQTAEIAMDDLRYSVSLVIVSMISATNRLSNSTG